MLKTLEEPPSHVKFILATTDPQKIPVTVLSRCLQFNLKQLPPVLIAAHLRYVLEQETITFDVAALDLVARAAQGSMRDALSLMDQAIAFSLGRVEEQVVRTMLGSIDQGYLFDLLTALGNRHGVALLEVADGMAAHSVAFDAALQSLATLLHRIALAQTVPQSLAADDTERERLLEMAHVFSPEEVQLYYQIAIHGRDEIDLAPDEYAGFTMTLLRMLAFAPAKAGALLQVVAQPEPKNRIESKPNVASANPAVFTPNIEKVSEVAPSYVPRAAVGELDWGTLLAQLNVQGMAQQLARHCVLHSFTEHLITLGLAPEHKHLQTNKMAADKLQAALSDYFSKPIKLSVVLSNQPVATPAVIEQQSRQVQQQQAIEAMAQDDFVREAQSELDARIVEDSIKPV
jgi:DNA polymerase-3 subunit gamma/tau